MEVQWRRWFPLALCCLPGFTVAFIIGLGLFLGGAAFRTAPSGSPGLGLIALALLASPLSMALMMRRQMNRDDAASETHNIADCCPPVESLVASETVLHADRLATLRAQREALEHELADMQVR